MNCPVCGGRTVIRGTHADCESVHRRRICVDCGYKFFTSEYESDGEDFLRLQTEYSKYYVKYEYYMPKKAVTERSKK